MGHLLLLEIVVVVNDNFSIQGRCPSTIHPFDKRSNLLALPGFHRQHVFRNSQVLNLDPGRKDISEPLKQVLT